MWRDLRHGENVDLYPVVVISLAATVLDVISLPLARCHGGLDVGVGRDLEW